MSNYVKATNFFSKDALLSGNPDKIIKGAEIDDEYNAIATAITTKADLNSPNFTGTPTVPTAPFGTSTTQVASTKFVQDATGTIALQDADSVAITGGSITGITDLTVEDGGTGQSTLAANAVLIGNGTSGITSIAPSTSGNVLKSNGTTWESTPADGMGDAVSISFGTTYVAATDGFVVANHNNSFTINSGFTITVAGNVIVNNTTSSEGANGKVSGTAPVKKGQSYIITQVGGGSPISAWFIPFGN